ncbi:MAG TPA: Spy/CpxP family protein refolding chaperone [Pyrinomonadaceae bacterium]|nr:Spy/CpxP family protein refolding chaperone [Pyrinomonadaceae bacterium]
MFLSTKLTVSALIIALMAGGSIALAQQPQTNNPTVGGQQPAPGFARRGARRGARLGRQRPLAQINLSDAQKQQVRTIIQAEAQSTEKQREEFRQLRQQYRTGTLTPEGQARARELRQQLMESRKGLRAQMMNTLTTEQKAKLQELREARRANHEVFGRRRRPVQ